MAEEQKNNMPYSEGKKTCLCSCGCHCGWSGGHNRLLRIVLGIVIILVVFWLGVKLGELQGILYSRGMEDRMMMYHGGMYNAQGNTQGNMPMQPATGTPTP